MSTKDYDYKVTEVYRFVDGDTFWLELDPGFRLSTVQDIRLFGWDCPETRRGSAFEKRKGAEARQATHDWLVAADPMGTLRCRTEKDPDDFGRWLGYVYRDEPGGVQTLGDWLASRGLATEWPTRWYQVYDPQRNLP